MDEIKMIPVDWLYSHPDNPRKELGDLTELTESIKANGVMQNLTVVPAYQVKRSGKGDGRRMKCEYCGANLARGTVGMNPASFIQERRERWPEVAWLIREQRIRRCEETAQGILDARALYPDKSLSWLYDEVTMPPELRAAHEANDRAVMDLYGFSYDMTEPEIVAELFRMYEETVSVTDE